MTAITLDFIDVAEFVAASKIPEKVIQRGTDAQWFVCNAPIDQAAPKFHASTWILVRAGQLVRVPLVPYVCQADAPTSMAAAVERGIGIGQLIAQENPLRVHMIMGRPVEHVGESAENMQYRFWLGFAVRVK